LARNPVLILSIVVQPNIHPQNSSFPDNIRIIHPAGCWRTGQAQGSC